MSVVWGGSSLAGLFGERVTEVKGVGEVVVGVEVLVGVRAGVVVVVEVERWSKLARLLINVKLVVSLGTLNASPILTVPNFILWTVQLSDKPLLVVPSIQSIIANKILVGGVRMSHQRVLGLWTFDQGAIDLSGEWFAWLVFCGNNHSRSIQLFLKKTSQLTVSRWKAIGHFVVPNQPLWTLEADHEPNLPSPIRLASNIITEQILISFGWMRQLLVALRASDQFKVDARLKLIVQRILFGWQRCIIHTVHYRLIPNHPLGTMELSQEPIGAAQYALDGVARQVGAILGRMGDQLLLVVTAHLMAVHHGGELACSGSGCGCCINSGSFVRTSKHPYKTYHLVDHSRRCNS